MATTDKPPHPLTGVVLAGGRSRRMGRDKALLEVGGEPLVVRVSRRLEAVCDRVVVASGATRRFSALPWEQVTDPPGGAGPLAGIVAGLETATTPLAAVVAVDMPHANTQVIAALAAGWRGEAAVVPLVGGRIHPLHGVYATSAAPTLRDMLDSGKRAVLHVLSALGARVVGEEGWAAADPSGSFVDNVNRPEDLAALVRLSAPGASWSGPPR